MSTYRMEWSCCDSESITDAWTPEECPFCALTEKDAQITSLTARVEHYKRACITTSTEVTRVLGEALYGPNPDAWSTHTPEAIADEAAEEIKRLRAKVEALEVDTRTPAEKLANMAFHVEGFKRERDEMAAMTEASLADYARDRLKAVSASTVRKEQSALRSFFAWCVERGHLTESPRVTSPPKRATGVPTGRNRNVRLAAEQVEGILANLPGETPSGIPIRDAMTLIWETSLRIATIRRLSVPEHYRRGEKVLRISADIDKSRFGRDIPLSPRARRILDRHADSEGCMFASVSEGTHRRYLTAAALEIGLTDDVASHVGPHTFRHAAITQLATSPSTNIGGVAMIAGHRTLSVTSRYVRAGYEAARSALDARIGTRIGTRTKSKKDTKRGNR